MFLAQAKTIDEIISVVETSVLTPIVSLLSALAVILFLWGAVEFIAGASNEDARTTGKRHMVWGILGLVIIQAAWAIITVLQNFFANIL